MKPEKQITRSFVPTWPACAAALACALLLSACGPPALTRQTVYKEEKFGTDTPFSRVIKVPSNVVCWSVKRALLSQGYLLDKNRDTAVMVGAKDILSDEETTVTLKLQVTCSSNSDGSSTVFATGEQEVSKVQMVNQSVSAGVSIATVTLPSQSGRMLTVVQRETIRDPQFYARFYTLVEDIANNENAAH